jgi:hypothetical protein
MGLPPVLSAAPDGDAEQYEQSNTRPNSDKGTFSLRRHTSDPRLIEMDHVIRRVFDLIWLLSLLRYYPTPD